MNAGEADRSEQLEALSHELTDCYSLMNENYPPQVRRGAATRLLWLIGDLCSVSARPEDGQIEAVLQDVEDYKSQKFIEIYVDKVKARLDGPADS